jgi:chitodextrinase
LNQLALLVKHQEETVNPKLRIGIALLATLSVILPAPAGAEIAAAHVYHNHMPNFWPFYAVDIGAKYNSTPVGGPIRYTYDGEVIELKKNPPAGYSYYLPGDGIMPHDDLVAYYSPDAKTGAYLDWPWQVAGDMNSNADTGQIHVTMSGAVVNNVQSLVRRKNVPGYDRPNWGEPWRNAYNTLRTQHGYRTFDLIHFTGHHSMGPLVGPDYFLKDLIYHNATLAQDYFLDGGFKFSSGFFPTELGFSERLIPTLAKLGVKWSVLGNNHLSRTLQDYPFDLYYPNKDTLISPPNRADLQNVSQVGAWVNQPMAHEQQQIVNKYPFASTPHWVRFVDPATGREDRLIGIPVDQAGSWLEGWEGQARVSDVGLQNFEGLVPQKLFFVIAHDGDNSSARAGSLETWLNGRRVTCTEDVKCIGIDEYLSGNMPPAGDIVHVQDGSWVDTRDSSSDPQWDHWHLPFGIWRGQFADFNHVTGLNLKPKTNLDGQPEGMTVSLEHGFHYLERNFALLQAALNYARTAEQIWLDSHPTYWQPTTAMDREITYAGNQLNPWMISFPVKGDPDKDYKGGANPAELAWYFLLPAMDSGFGYYDENKDDQVKGTLAFNNSLYFSKRYVQANLANDHTGPSVWWPQRWPYNPGSVNADKSEGWTVHHFDNHFAVYTYAYDVSGISGIKARIRPHQDKTITATDNTFRVYDPAALKAAGVPNIDPTEVGNWKDYPLTRRDLKPVMNGVAWNKANMDTMAVLPAQEIGDLYYTYLGDYRDQIVDYYIEATDSKGNVTRSEIQQVYVGMGRYNKVGGRYVEAADGNITGTYPFLDTIPPTVPGKPTVTKRTDCGLTLAWVASSDKVGVAGYELYRNGTQVGTTASISYADSGFKPQTTYAYAVLAYDTAGNKSARGEALQVTDAPVDSTPPSAPGQPVASNVTASTVMLSWPAAKDDCGVTQYAVYRDGKRIGTTATTTYTDSTAAPKTTYKFSVMAADAAANESASSSQSEVTTPDANRATVYYFRKDWIKTCFHYAPTGGNWTTPPGVTMEQACPSWWVKKDIILGSATGMAATFNDCAGVWDNNSGRNYALGMDISAVKDGQVTVGVSPCHGGDDITPPSVPTGG